MLFVGVTTHTENFSELTEGEHVYIDVLQRIGITPVLMTNTADFVEIETQLSKLDGLVLIGGGDVHPCHYGELVDPNIAFMNLNRDRDLCELQLARRAYAYDMPTLGICRGNQVMNVAMGGTLISDLLAHGKADHDHNQQKPYTNHSELVHIQPETRLFDLLFGAENRHIDDIDWILTTNSMHHQAINRPAFGFYINAISADGVYEGCEDPSRRFFIGVQWHPEYLENCLPLFTGFREACLEAKA